MYSGAFVQPMLQWKINKYLIFWVCFSRLKYPACKAHGPCCHLWPVRLYGILSRYLINSTMFVKKLLNIKGF